MPNPVVHFEVLGKDSAKLGSFYSDLFGWKVDTNNPMNYGIVEAPDGRGIGGGISSSPDGTTLVTFYVEVADPQAVLDQAAAKGGAVVMPVMEVPEGPTIAQFADPEGNIIGLVKAGDM